MSTNQSMSAAKDYGFNAPEKPTTDLTSREESRAMHEVQAAFVIAKKFPRNEHAAFSAIVKACERPFLAEQALYAYPKGGKNVEGASIRLAEMLLQYWGNCESGIREISQANGVSVAEAFAVDLQTNTRITKVFHVPHVIGTKQGPKKLTDPRDIYELVANQGARRMRACILGIIPGDIVDAAVEKCKHTMIHGGIPLADKLRTIALKFEEIGVKISHIEKRLKHSYDITTAQEGADLQIIYKSIRDGMSKRQDFFDIGDANETGQNVNDLISAKKNNVVVEQKANDSKEADIIDNETGEILPPQTATSPEPVTQSNGINFDALKKQLENAKSLDTLNIAADLIKDCPLEKQAELTTLFHKRMKEVK